MRILREGRFIEGLLLRAAIEDYVPLWELPGELATAWANDVSRNIRDAKRTVPALLERGLVEFYLSDNWNDDTLARIPDDEVAIYLQDERYWTHPMENDQQTWVRMSATPWGEERCWHIPAVDLWDKLDR